MCSKTAKGLVLTLVTAIASIIAARPAMASFTTIHGTAPAEDTRSQILSHTYGGSFHASGMNLTNGTVLATRVDDSADQVWHQPITSANAVARFGSYSQSFGSEAGSAGGSFQKLFDVHGYGFNVIGSATGLNLGPDFRLAHGGQGGVDSSLNADNAHGADHMVTYQISGLGDGLRTYLLFFEDGHDFDFNDLSVQLKAPILSGKSPEPRSVPLPAAAWMGFSTFFAAGTVGGARRLRQMLS